MSIKPNTNRKWNEGAGYAWCRDDDGNALAITKSDYAEAQSAARRKPDDAQRYLRRCRNHEWAFAAAYMLGGFVAGVALAFVLCRATGH